MIEIPPSTTPFHLLQIGPFERDQVRCTLTGTRIPVNLEVEQLIASAWEGRMRTAQERGQLLFPGAMCRLEAWSTSDERLDLVFGLTDYREFVGTNLTHPEIAERFGDNYLSNGAGVRGTIETADGYQLLQRRSDRVFEDPGTLSLCGGSLDPIALTRESVADPFAVMEREIDEELTIPASAIESMVCLGLERDSGTLKPNVLFRTRLSLGANELTALSGDEHTELILVPADPVSLSTWVTEHWSEIAPTGLACLVAHLAISFANGVAGTWQR